MTEIICKCGEHLNLFEEGVNGSNYYECENCGRAYNIVESVTEFFKEKQKEIKSKKYQVVGYIKVEPEAVEPQTYEEALKDKESQELMQPENIYQIKEIKD